MFIQAKEVQKYVGWMLCNLGFSVLSSLDMSRLVDLYLHQPYDFRKTLYASLCSIIFHCASMTTMTRVTFTQHYPSLVCTPASAAFFEPCHLDIFWHPRPSKCFISNPIKNSCGEDMVDYHSGAKGRQNWSVPGRIFGDCGPRGLIRYHFSYDILDLHMCIYIYVCVCVYLYINIYIYIYLFIYLLIICLLIF